MTPVAEVVAPTALNPFVGLRPFEAGDTLLFFGRQQQSTELLERLHHARFVSVVGSSGCGKSSLVRAGLIPRLEAGLLVGDRDVWFVHTMKPGDTPIENLATALVTTADPSSTDLGALDSQSLAKEIHDGGAQAVLDAVSRRFARGDSNLLLLVDQFEEVFRFSLEGKEPGDSLAAANFVSVMLALAEQRDVPIYVIMTMRSDFLGDCDRFHGLPEAMNRSQYLVPRLTRQQRREAIEGPIRLFGQEIAPRLNDRLLNENFDTRDDLPILQHALMRTWDNWRAVGVGPVDLPHYVAIGTLSEALSRDAEAAIAGLTEEQLRVAERLFQSLTTVDSANRRIRQPARLSDIAARIGASTAEIWLVIERFRSDGRSFLVVSSERPQDNPLVDISHESLIRQWARLTTWVDEESESIRTYNRLADTAALHKVGRAGLYRDPDLQVALDWRDRTSPNAAWARGPGERFAEAMSFLDESKGVRDHEWAEREFARRWRLPRAVVAGVVLVFYFFNFGIDALSSFWSGFMSTLEELFGGVLGLLTRISDRQAGELGEALANGIKISLHVLLFVGVAGMARRVYRVQFFKRLAVASPRVQSGEATRRFAGLKKIRRALEEAAKWTSVIVGLLILGSCSFMGVDEGGAGGPGMVLLGAIIALVLVGWVFAVARLNSDIKAMSKTIDELPKASTDVTHLS